MAGSALLTLLTRLALLAGGFIGGALLFLTRARPSDDPAQPPDDTEAMLRLVVQNLPDAAVIAVDREMRYVLAEGVELVVTGYDPAAMVGRTVREVLSDSGAEFVENGYRRAFNGESFVFERYAQGRYYVGRFTPVRNAGGEIVYGLAIVQNLTELTEVKRARNDLQAVNERLNRSLEDLRVANQDIQRFTHIVSHDLRAPLISLTGFTQLLRESFANILRVIDDVDHGLTPEARQTIAEDLDDTVPTSLQFIAAATQRLDTLTNAVLKLARYGRIDVRLEEIDMRALIEEIIDSMAARLREGGITIMMHSMTPIVADRLALTIILGNLLDNATKYLDPARTGMITVEMHAEADTVTVHVRDNGVGIAPEDYRLVFEPFQRGDIPNTEGQGMGLAYVQTLVNRLGGQITFTSQLGVGTTFSVTLPQRTLPDSPAGRDTTAHVDGGAVQ